MSSRERRLLDKDIEIRKLQGELKHYKTCFFSCVFEKDCTRKALDVALDALDTIKPKKDVSQGGFWTLSQSDILDVILRAEKEIKRITKGGSNE